MKSIKTLICAVLLLFVALPVYAEVAFDYFMATSFDNYVELRWQTSLERSIVRFEVERSTDQVTWLGGVSSGLPTSDPHGAGLEYRVNDANIFKQGSKTFYYRIVSIDTKGRKTYSEVIRVDVQISDFQQTWGSLKAMFR